MSSTTSAGPRSMNHCASASVKVPVLLAVAAARVMVGSRLPPPNCAANSKKLAQPSFGTSPLNRLVPSEFQAMIGTMASTRQSVPAAMNCAPPPYEAPTIPRRGSPATSSWASGRDPTKSISCWMSRPSNSGLSICASPPDSPNPRGSQVSTLYPASSRAPIDTVPAVPRPSTSTSPALAQPGPISTVGAGASAPATGNQWARMTVPSKLTTSQSRSLPRSDASSDTRPLGGVQVADPPGAALPGVEPDVVSTATVDGGSSPPQPETSRPTETRAATTARRERMPRGYEPSGHPGQ